MHVLPSESYKPSVNGYFAAETYKDTNDSRNDFRG